jgi:hypothetical protein
MANANSNASARGIERSSGVHKKKIVITGVEFIEADNATDNKFEVSTGTTYDQLLKDLIGDYGVAGAIDRLSINGSKSDTIAFVWDHLDDLYNSYYITELNSAFIDLGIVYAQHLLKGGEALTDLTGKFQPDNNGDGIPQRDQSLHDNLLGNLDEFSITDRFGAAGDDAQFAKIVDAGLGELLGVIGDTTDGRDYYGGYQGEDATAARSFDAGFFML